MSLILDGTSAGGSIASFLTIDDTNDRIGIGTASPLSGLHISDGTNAGSPQNASRKATLMIDAGATASADLQFMVRSGYNSHIFFGDAADPNIGMIWYDHSTNHMNFSANTIHTMTIDDNGRIGIGATNPGGSKLHVQDNNTTTVTDATTMLSNTTFSINGNNSQGSDVMRIGPMSTGGRYFIDVSKAAFATPITL